MSQRIAIVVTALTTAAALVVVASATPAVSQTIREVFVTNFPRVQPIEGEVSIKGAVRLSRAEAFRSILVPPVRPTETTRLVDAGTLVTDGFSSVVLSLHGQVKGSVVRKGAVGAILVPAEESIQTAFNEQGHTHFALDVRADEVSAETSFFASNQPRHVVGFGSYRVLLYNTTDKTVSVDLFGYLTN